MDTFSVPSCLQCSFYYISKDQLAHVKAPCSHFFIFVIRNTQTAPKHYNSFTAAKRKKCSSERNKTQDKKYRPVASYIDHISGAVAVF